MRTNDIFTTTYSPGSDPLRSVFGGLEGVPTGSALGNEIKAYHDAMESLQSGGLESGDSGNVLRDSENAVHQNASAIDDAMNL